MPANPTPEIAEDLAACSDPTCGMVGVHRYCEYSRPTPPKVAGDAEEIDRLEALLAKATLGPWIDAGGTIGGSLAPPPNDLEWGDWYDHVQLNGPDYHFICETETGTDEGCANLQLIVAAVNALPSLIAQARANASLAVEIEALRGERDDWKAAWQALRKANDAITGLANRNNEARLAAERKLEAAVALLTMVEAPKHESGCRFSFAPVADCPTCRPLQRSRIRTFPRRNEHGG
jgi:hypothetical protein